MSNCVHDNGKYCEVFSDKEIRQPCFETPLCEDYKEIVRCKDCKYWDYEVDNDVGFCVRTEDCDWNADDFCSRGEKR